MSLAEAACKSVHVDWHSLRLRLDLIRLLPAASKPLTVAMAVNVVVGSIVPPLLMISVGKAVSAIAGAVREGQGSHAAHQLLLDLIVVGVLFAIGQANAPLQYPLADQLGMKTRTLVFRRVLAAYLGPASLEHLEDPNLKDAVDRAQDPRLIGTRQAVSGLLTRWGLRLGSVGGFVLLGLYRWWAAFIMLAVVIHVVRQVRVAHFEISRNLYGQSKTFRRSGYLRDLLLRAGAEKETRVFGLGDWIIDRFSSEWNIAMAPVWERRRLSAWEMVAGFGPAYVAVTVIAVLALRDTLHHSIGVGELVVVLQALLSAYGAVSISNLDTQVELGIVTLQSAQDLESALHNAVLQMPGTKLATNLPVSEIRFEDVHFAYPGSSREVLSGLDLVVPAGRSLAIVGDNGAGKTTLIKLLTRLFDPTSGRISADGTLFTDLDPASWQQRCAAVFQDFVRYPWSVADNISLRPGADRGELEQAARQANVLELVESLPHGWDTVLHRQFGGVDLSGGEWQRIALARAMFAADHGASVLVLDEPTAHLDARQEAIFYDQFLDLTADRTSIIVSHRFATVRRADSIVVLHEGRVSESGNHDQLMEVGGRYAQMFSLQAVRYEGTSDDHA